MNYCALFTSHHVALIHDWLAEAGSLLVRIERPHSGASGDSHTVHSLKELRALIGAQVHPECEIFVFRDALTEEDLEKIHECNWVYRNADRVLYIGLTKNRNWYERFEREPTRYNEVVRDWISVD